MRIALSVVQYVSDSYMRKAWKIYYKWIEDLIFFWFYLNNFGRICSSWLIQRSVKRDFKDNLHATWGFRAYQDVEDQLITQTRTFNRRINLALILQFVLSLFLAVLNQIATSKLHKGEIVSEAVVWVFIASTLLFTTFQVCLAVYFCYVTYNC